MRITGDDGKKDGDEDGERKTRETRMTMTGEDGYKVKTTQEDLHKSKKTTRTRMTVSS